MAARGLWIEMIALMHEASPYGHLLVSGQSPTDAQLAVLAGAPSEQISDLLGELESAGVFSRTKEGVIYSRKMTRTAKKAAVARRNGKNGGNPSLRNHSDIPASDNQIPTDRVKPQKPEARNQKGSDGFANAQPSAAELFPDPPPPTEPVTKNKGDGPRSAEDRFWAMAPKAQERGVARSLLGQLANALNGDFERGVGILSDALAAKSPRPYLARIIRNVASERAPPVGGIPAWAAEARAQGYPVNREGKFWRMAGALYDDEGEQIGN